MSQEMTCAEAEPLLPLVADGALDPDSDSQLFAHLAGCPACQRIVASHDLIGLAIRRSHQPTAQPQRIIPWLWPVAAAAGVALAAGLWFLPASATPTTMPRSVAGQNLPASPAAPVLPPAEHLAPATTTPATGSTPDVIALQRGDGSTVYMVRQDGVWVSVDPSALDGPLEPSSGSGSGVQVRY